MIDQQNQVWSTGSTYVPMPQGFAYLVAVMDWFSRYVLSWRISNTLEVDFCLEALDEALSIGKPEIFNSDQGSQLTSPRFTGHLEMDTVEHQTSSSNAFGARSNSRTSTSSPTTRLHTSTGD